jgi:hypothetical protein
MFAVLTFERDPMQLQDVPAQLFFWVQSAGGWAAFGILLWLLIGYRNMREVDRARIAPWKRNVFLVGIVIAALSYIVAAIGWITSVVAETPHTGWRIEAAGLAIGGLAALVAAGLPFVVGISLLRFRRVWALARLSFKEAIRRRVLYAFSFILLIFLFASWFIPHKPEDQVRSYVVVVYWTMTILLLVAAIILAAFSIPTDIRNQTIHTITTKPVERFEIFLGRFLGFTALMTLVLVLMTAVSAIYVLRGIDPEAAAESLKAREPLYGVLHFENTGEAEGQGINIGREWNYRSYITAGVPNVGTPYAIWEFTNIPRALAERDKVRCEFAFDIYRTTKGFENRGVSCEFEFLTANFQRNQKDKFNEERSRLLSEPNRPSEAAIDNELAEKYGYYAVPAKDITDYHTMYLEVPKGLFLNALNRQSSSPSASRGDYPPLEVRVSVTKQSTSQYVGMAKYDFYWRLDDPQPGSEKAAFTYNFFKGAFGLWLRLCLVIGLSVVMSTQLSGVISMLVAGLLYLSGGVIGYISSIGMGTAPGGGPMEALVRLANRQIALIPLEDSATATVATTTDEGFRWFIRRILDLIPDVDRYDLTSYVGEGFNIPITQLLLDAGTLGMYLLPWIVLAYYLLKWREIAAPT